MRRYLAFMDAGNESRIKTLLRLSGFKSMVAKADLVIAGEGSFAGQSLQGKVYSGIRKYVPKKKLVFICLTSKIIRPDVPVYETSQKDAPFPYAKNHAKEDYQSILRKVLSESMLSSKKTALPHKQGRFLETPTSPCFAAFGGALSRRLLGHSPSEMALRMLSFASSGVSFRSSAS